MGFWGTRTFENDAAADWVYDLEEAIDSSFLLTAIKNALKAKGPVDLDDSIEALAAAEVLAAAREVSPKNIPAAARQSILRLGLSPGDDDLNLALKAVRKIADKSDLADSWRNAGKQSAWRKDLTRLENRLRNALDLPKPARKSLKEVVRENLAQLMIRVSETKDPDAHRDLLRKLEGLKDPNKPIGAKGFNTMTPLHWAASRNLLDAARLLVERGAEVDAQLPALARPIGFAIEANYPSMIEFLVQSGADRAYALNFAAQSDRLTILKSILRNKTDQRIKSPTGGSLLHTAARCNSVKVLKFLLAKGLNVNQRDDYGSTPLHEAAGYCNVASTKALLEAGASVAIKDNEGKTPLYEAKEVAELEPRIWKLLSNTN